MCLTFLRTYPVAAQSIMLITSLLLLGVAVKCVLSNKAGSHGDTGNNNKSAEEYTPRVVGPHHKENTLLKDELNSLSASSRFFL